MLVYIVLINRIFCPSRSLSLSLFLSTLLLSLSPSFSAFILTSFHRFYLQHISLQVLWLDSFVCLFVFSLYVFRSCTFCAFQFFQFILRLQFFNWQHNLKDLTTCCSRLRPNRDRSQVSDRHCRPDLDYCNW